MSGLIYLAIVGVWVVVLLPMWLGRHDHSNPEKSVDRFTRAMNAIARRNPLPVQDMVSPKRVVDVPEMAAEVVVVTPVEKPRRIRTAADRRRRVLFGIGALLAALSVLAVLKVVPFWTIGVPAALAVLYVLMVRRQIVAHRASVRAMERRRVARHAAPAADVDADAETVLVDATWEAQPTPLPTYVSKPAATAVPRVIDQREGAWSGSAMVAAAQEERRIARETVASAQQGVNPALLSSTAEPDLSAPKPEEVVVERWYYLRAANE